MNNMIDFQGMNSKQAHAFLDTWVSTTPERRIWLNKALQADSYPELRDNIESLKQVGEWLCERAKLRDLVVLGGPMPDLSNIDLARVPMWYDESAAGAFLFDDWTMWAIDAAALNYGHVMTTLDPDIKWVVDHERVKRYIDQNRPSLKRKGGSRPQNPVGAHIGMLYGFMMKHTPGSESIQMSIDFLNAKS